MTQGSNQHNLASPAKDDTNPCGLSAYRKKSKFRRWLIGLALAAIVVLGLMLIYRSFSKEQKPGGEPAIAIRKPNQPLPSAQITDRLTAQLQVNEITAMETVARKEKNSFGSFLDKCRKRAPCKPAIGM